MDIIRLLPDSVANQIAAGEVIQRPASVIKELVENSIDAGAHNIDVSVVDAGRTSIQVIDDGKGMSDTDARLSFERHATSKIQQAEDLFTLHTMGFRGEALASIAAVAQVTLKTRTIDDEVGTELHIEGSNVVSQEPIACPVGSNFTIENLFFNIPARRKFLKSNATEMNNIMQAFERIALVYPDVAFSIRSNGTELLHLKPTNTHQRISDVFGKRINQELVPVETETTLCTIKGYVATPQNAKKKGCHQYFFVNGRYMKHPYFHKAVMSAYDRLIPEGEQVSYFIYLTVNPENIDVNIHPVKTEIKFDNEQAIWQIIMATVRDAIGRFTGATSLDFDQEGKPNIPVFTPDENTMAKAPHIDFNPNYNPFKGAANNKSSSRPSAKGWEELFKATNDKSAPNSQLSTFNSQLSPLPTPPSSPSPFKRESERVPSPFKGESERVLTPLSQPYKGRYILCEGENGMIIIDQHRASQRVLFERYRQAFEVHNAHTQKVLFPEVIQFPASYSDQLSSTLKELQHLGFDISNLGGGSYSINGVPAGLGGMDATKLVGELVNEAIEQGVKASEEVHTILALGLAKRAATPVGEIMSPEDTENLIKQLFECSTQKYTPDGKLILTEIPDDELLRKFH